MDRAEGQQTDRQTALLYRFSLFIFVPNLFLKKKMWKKQQLILPVDIGGIFLIQNKADFFVKLCTVPEVSVEISKC